jgi:type III pantothenate kinase
VLGANVAGATVGGRLGAFLERAGLAAEWIRPMAEGYGVRNAYLDPSRLGADRWAALVGARAIHGAAALVTSGGHHGRRAGWAGGVQGGVILPGWT